MITAKGARTFVPCRKCNFCLRRRQMDWALRLAMELKRSKSAWFITWTYDDKHVPLTESKKFMTLDKAHLFTHLKSLKRAQSRLLTRLVKRKKMKKEDKAKWRIRYYAVGEYGSKYGRPHYHAIVFNLHNLTRQKLNHFELWQKGLMYFGDVNEKSICYVTKYLIDKPDYLGNGQAAPFSTMSRDPGLGNNYIKERKKWHRGKTLEEFTTYAIHNGYRHSIPRYYKDKLFNKLERTILGKKSMDQLYEKYEEEIQELAKVHSDPVAYYEERLTHAHNSIKSKSEKRNKF